MSKIILKAENISKQYRLGTVGSGTLRDDFKRSWARIRGKEDPFLKVGAVNDRSQKSTEDYVWALRDINFEVQQGEVLGIIGKNGAGKSTLLKILSRVTAPSTGVIKSRGRIASLLEVGTGFNHELTGRENIYLNGAILGMTKAEISSKLDEIIDFSGCERYIDTPTKRYSSGMTVRLAFAVAAFLEPEILVVDEVLAVGDAEFQKKAIGKMQDISQGEGRTVLFVSHNMASVSTLCSRGILLENGIVKMNSEIDSVVRYYLSGDETSKHRIDFANNINYSTKYFQLHNIAINNAGDEEEYLKDNLPIDVTTVILLKCDNPEIYHLTYHLISDQGEAIFSFYSVDVTFERGLNNVTCTIPKYFLQPGNFYLSLFIVKDKKKIIFQEKSIIKFTVCDSARNLGVFMGREPGYIRPEFKWRNIVSK